MYSIFKNGLGISGGMTPIYDSDGTIMTMEKFLAKHTEKKD